ncbi:hypothetical protein L2E82_33693 [Cichorium intybus]|uniref:Uncharacterized protein n=1 Tax=Cichorium intybus TaxID=13427 RepID=A0ACB9BKW7_CICIN|nr:hypothetical protein L2E82_33693 [Cichorium intybus]
MWSTKDFKDRQNYEIEEGGFGLGNIVPENQISYENKNNELASEHEGTEFPLNKVSKRKQKKKTDWVKRMKDLFWVNFSPKDNNSEFCGDEHLNGQENYQEGDNVMNEADNGGKDNSGLVEFEPIQPLQQVSAEVPDTYIDVEKYIALENIIGENDDESSYVTPKNIVKVYGDISEGGNEANIRIIENEEQMVDIKGKKTEKEVVQNVRAKPKRNMMFRCDPDKESMEILFETSPGDILTRHQFESMRPDHSIHGYVIDCWTTVLDFEENKLKSKSSPSCLFFNTQILVFFPIHNGDQFYAIVFNYTSMEIIILDSTRFSRKIEDMYGKIPQLLQSYIVKSLENIKFKKASLKENNKSRMRITKLRGFYVAKFATHTMNRKRKRNMEEANEFANIDRKTRAKMTKDGIDARNELQMGNK